MSVTLKVDLFRILKIRPLGSKLAIFKLHIREGLQMTFGYWPPSSKKVIKTTCFFSETTIFSKFSYWKNTVHSINVDPTISPVGCIMVILANLVSQINLSQNLWSQIKINFLTVCLIQIQITRFVFFKISNPPSLLPNLTYDVNWGDPLHVWNNLMSISESPHIQYLEHHTLVVKLIIRLKDQVVLCLEFAKKIYYLVTSVLVLVVAFLLQQERIN